jgi:uncharacterized membrane protein YeaQ/YmgE (transglycosylase-associated protein family)
VVDIVWAIVVGFFAGIIARFVTPGPGPRGFILTTVLGIVGAVVATFLGQAIGLYHPGEVTNFLGQIIGAIVVLLVWRQLVPRR